MWHLFLMLHVRLIHIISTVVWHFDLIDSAPVMILLSPPWEHAQLLQLVHESI
jgi:hypothetical protein